MKHDAKIHAQPERDEKTSTLKPPVPPEKTAKSGIVNLDQNDLQDLSPDDILDLQRTIGNKAVARLMALRGGAVSEISNDSQDHREGEQDELAYPGPRTKTLSKDTVQGQGGADQRYAPDQRGLVIVPAASGAVNLDGEGLYGWYRSTDAWDVVDLMENLVTDEESSESDNTIWIYSGTHGLPNGDLGVDEESPDFVNQDQQIANHFMAEYPGTDVEVFDVSTFSKDELMWTFGMTDTIRILAWCFSAQSYGLGESIKSTWWPEPDHLQIPGAS